MEKRAPLPYPTLFGCAAGSSGRVVVVGVPYDRGTASEYAGCARAPSKLRELSDPNNTGLMIRGMHDFAQGRTVLQPTDVSDIGDLPYRANQDDQAYMEFVAHSVRLVLEANKQPLLLGGDHLITLAALRGVARVHQRIQLIQFDAHHDCGMLGADERATHSNFIRQVASEQLATQIIQVGVRGFTYEGFSLPDCVRFATPANVYSMLDPTVPIYLTVDTDAFDPSIAPGVSYPEPEGLGPDALYGLLDQLRAEQRRIVAADWTEYNPRFDTERAIGGRLVLKGLARLIAAMQPHNGIQP